ncbi:MAG: hypothetical protein AB1631_28485, partial [Acidobacteriota bacterium]
MMNDLLASIGIVFIVVGLFNCFAGYWLFKFQLRLIGFIIGFALGFGLSKIALIGLVCGIISTFLIEKLYFVGVFFVGAGFGLLLGHLLTSGTGRKSDNFLLLIFAIIGGIAAIFFNKL